MTSGADALDRAARHAPFLRQLIAREAALADLLANDRFDEALERALARAARPTASAALRHARAGVALVTAIADLAGAWPLEQVTATLSAFADRALDLAIAWAFAERDADPGGLAVLALGKLGSGELNYSSDIDLIILHDPERLPRRPTEDPTEAAVRIVRRVVALLSERTADGYVFRVDLRLRPDPDSTPASLAVGAAEAYYQSEALTWERAAFIRARPAAGDRALGARFLDFIAPFVWRRSLDYSALAEIREISARIRDHFGDVEEMGPGFDLKRGRGGIREIEFYAHVHQLIFGGREPALRAPATMDALAALAAAGRIDPADAATLAEAYRALRTAEHRVQMLGDQQTHAIPRTADERRALAGLCGQPGWKALEAALARQTRAVARCYDRLLAVGQDDRGERLPAEEADVARWAERHRLADADLLATLVRGWRSGRMRSLRVPESRQAFERVIPGLLRTTARGRHGRAGLLRLDQFIRALPSGVQFWRLLAAQPPLAATLARLLTSTPALADALSARPQLIDVLLDPHAPLGGAEDAVSELRQAVAGLAEEPLLDRVRHWTAERRFQLGVRLLEGAIAPSAMAAELAAMAEAAVVILAETTHQAFAARHGRPPDSELVILALGRLGGQALTFQSDLDLIFLFTGDWERTVAPCGWRTSGWYNRLAPRIVSALSAPTASGNLYDVDTRLRPSGADGPLAISLDSFARYQERDAEIWEQMALTRARPITGTPAARADAQALIDRLVARPREAAAVRAEAAAMRRHMARHKPASGLWDLKLARGGLVDLEFILASRALLAGTAVPPDLAMAARRLAPALEGPHELLLSALVALRLVKPHDDGGAPDAASAALIARACGMEDLAALKAALQQARRTVMDEWRAEFGEG